MSKVDKILNRVKRRIIELINLHERIEEIESWMNEKIEQRTSWGADFNITEYATDLEKKISELLK